MPQEPLVHLVPTVPPAFNGLADYCHQLWRHWPAPRAPWHVLAAHVPPGAHKAWPDVQIRPFHTGKSGLLEALEASGARRVVLHYVGYAYHPKGVPLWLPPALRAYKSRCGAQIITMFHELWPRASPRQSAFWLSPLARGVAVQLAHLSQSWVTNCPHYAALLDAQTRARPPAGHIIPVGTNIVPAQAVDFARPWKLPLRAVIFGLANSRLWSLTSHEALLRRLVEQDLVQSITLLGQGASEADEIRLRPLLRRIGPDALWRRCPDLAPAEVSAVLAEQDVGLVYNSPDILTKSTAYAALCAHGVVPVVAPVPAHAPREMNRSLIEQLPFLPGDGAQTGPTVEALRDGARMRELRLRLGEAARGVLSWDTIARQWAQIIAPDAPGS